jgi:hypothetical protein
LGLFGGGKGMGGEPPVPRDRTRGEPRRRTPPPSAAENAERAAPHAIARLDCVLCLDRKSAFRVGRFAPDQTTKSPAYLGANHFYRRERKRLSHRAVETRESTRLPSLVSRTAARVFVTSSVASERGRSSVARDPVKSSETRDSRSPRLGWIFVHSPSRG